MVASITKYAECNRVIAKEFDPEINAVNLALVLSTYTPNTLHQAWADVSANELATGGGYLTGGKALAAKVLTSASFSADPVIWTTLTATFRYGVLYGVGTFAGIVNPLLAYILYNTAPDDIVVNGVNFTNNWHTSGIFTLGP